MDAIVYGVLISLGFATYENYEYVFIYSNIDESLFVAILRAFSAIPMHATTAIIMGYYLGMHIFRLEKFSLLSAIFYPIIFHSVYNLLLGVSLILWLMWLAFLLLFARNLHQRFIKQQSKKSKEDEVKLA